MSWEQLIGMRRENERLAAQWIYRVPIACPNDGEPLERNSQGVLHCPSDGWTYPNDLGLPVR